MKNIYKTEVITLTDIVGGGRAIGELSNGKKAFVWGGLPGETVKIQVLSKKSSFIEGIVIEVIKASPDRIKPRDESSYLATSPWQIMNFMAEQKYKAKLINDAFSLQHTTLPNEVTIYTDNNEYSYRNKIEYSWWWNKETSQIDLAFFSRGSHNKTPIEQTSLANKVISDMAINIRNLIRNLEIKAYDLKTLLVRCDKKGRVVAQLYVKNEAIFIDKEKLDELKIGGFEIIFSNPKSPASVITKRVQAYGNLMLSDDILGIDFSYNAESFFQINLPVYEQALMDIKSSIDNNKPIVDLYSGVGTIGLTMDAKKVLLVESNEAAVKEMKNNISKLGLDNKATAILSEAEKSLDYITSDCQLIVDPPRAGMHDAVIDKIIEVLPKRIIYLSCNPITQARDISRLLDKYTIGYHRGYNFFPRTPHIEHLVILYSKKA